MIARIRNPGIVAALLLFLFCVNIGFVGLLGERSAAVVGGETGSLHLLFSSLIQNAREFLGAYFWVRLEFYIRANERNKMEFRHATDFLYLVRIITWLNPHDISAYRIGNQQLWLNLKNPKMARTFAEEGVRNNPEDPTLNFIMGMMEFHAFKNYRRALFFLERSFKHAPLWSEKKQCLYFMKVSLDALGQKDRRGFLALSRELEKEIAESQVSYLKVRIPWDRWEASYLLHQNRQVSRQYDLRFFRNPRQGVLTYDVTTPDGKRGKEVRRRFSVSKEGLPEFYEIFTRTDEADVIYRFPRFNSSRLCLVEGRKEDCFPFKSGTYFVGDWPDWTVLLQAAFRKGPGKWEIFLLRGADREARKAMIQIWKESPASYRGSVDGRMWFQLDGEGALISIEAPDQRLLFRKYSAADSHR
ncbi:MAG: hypothetical protein HYU64_04560 [Armatimonadetes bacterium]|nr:hypothetical protein [Armatimonadota bacterium]